MKLKVRNYSIVKYFFFYHQILGGLVYSSPDFVGSIEIVNKRGKLVQLEQRNENENENTERDYSIAQDHDDAQDEGDKEVYHVMTNSKYVANIAFNKDADTDRKTR